MIVVTHGNIMRVYNLNEGMPVPPLKKAVLSRSEIVDIVDVKINKYK